MSNPCKSLSSQVVVITGATSRIGLATARMASRQGAILVLAASNATTLERLATEIRLAGGEVLAVPVDVTFKHQVASLGTAAVQRFGRIDSWVNAGMALDDPDDIKPAAVAARLFKTHYWGAAYGASVALDLMKEDGGAIINLDCAGSAKHGVKTYTDALRAEAEGTPVSLTLIHAACTGAKNAPHLVAEAILHAAQHGQRDMLVGSMEPMPARRVRFAPRVLGKCLAFFTPRQPAGGIPRPFP